VTDRQSSAWALTPRPSPLSPARSHSEIADKGVLELANALTPSKTARLL
jgi:hypothetical protein